MDYEMARQLRERTLDIFNTVFLEEVKLHGFGLSDVPCF